MADTRFSAVLAAPYQALVRRLELTTDLDPSLAGPRDMLLRPVELLRLIAGETPVALGDDPLAADRLRTLLYLAEPFGALVDLAGRVIFAEPEEGSDASPVVSSAIFLDPRELPPPEPYQPGVLDCGALPILAAGAARVAPPGLRDRFRRGLLGLALAASPAEVLGRLDPELPDEAALVTVVQALHLLETLGTAMRAPYLRTFVLDPVERGRWHSLFALFDPDRLGKLLGQGRWDGAHARTIQSVVPKDARPGQPVELRGSYDFFLTDADDDRVVGVPDDLRVVFAAPGGQLLPARILSARVRTGPIISLRRIGRDVDDFDAVITVEVPAGAAPGWIGFSVDEEIADSNQYRAGLRRGLAAEYAEDDCLAYTRVPVEVIPDLARPDPDRPGRLLAMPARGADNRLIGGTPLLLHTRIVPAVVEPGAEVTLEWEAVGADSVVRLPEGTRLEPRGRLVFTAPLTDGPLEIRLVPHAGDLAGAERRADAEVRTAAVRIREVRVSQDGHAAPLWRGRPLDVAIELAPPTSRVVTRLLVSTSDAPLSGTRVPAELVEDGLLITAEIAFTADGPAVDRKVVGPLAVGARGEATVVLFRPAVLDPDHGPVGRDQARDALVAAGTPLGLDVDVVELPWADDALAVLPEAVRGGTDPAVPALLEALARRALVTVGLEDALWLALLPGEARRGVAVAVPSAAARAVAVADLHGEDLGGVLAAAWRDPVAVGAHVPRLRLRVDLEGELVVSHQVVNELRAAGPGPAAPSPFVAVTYDGQGRTLGHHKLGLVHRERTSYLEALLPAGGAAAVEVRAGEYLLLHVAKPGGTLSLASAELLDEPLPHVSWTASHSGGARPQFVLAARRGGFVTPVAPIEACGGRDRVFLDRLGAVDGLVLIADDGWSLADADLGREQPEREHLALRLLPDGRWFADAPAGWQLSWRLDGRAVGSDQRFLSLPDDAHGLLEVQARSPEGAVRLDARPVEGRAR